MSSNSSSKRVVEFLIKNFPQSYNAKTLSKLLHIRESTVKVILNRALNAGKINREFRGFYQANVNRQLLSQLEDPPILLHGIMLECKTSKKLQKCVEGIPTKEYCDDVVKLLTALDFQKKTNHRFCRNLWFELWKITITVQLNGKIDVYINSSKNPLSYPDFLRILTFLDGVLEKLSPFIDRSVVDVKQIGVARDFKQLRLDGVSSVSLKVFRDTWARIYYKEDIKATRFEHHLTGKMNLLDALLTLSFLTKSPDSSPKKIPDDPNNPSYG